MPHVLACAATPLHAGGVLDSPNKDERYTDQARLHIKVVGDDRRGPPVDEWVVTIDAGGRVDRAELRDVLLESLSPNNYELSEQHNVVHWGAAGASYDLFIAIAGGAGASVVFGQIQNFLTRVRQRRNEEPVSEEDAVHSARARLCRRYEVNFGDLDLIGVDNDFESNRATVTLADLSGTRYEVEVYWHNSQVTVARIGHQAGQDPAPKRIGG